MDEKTVALEAIRKKLVGKELNYKEVYAIMDQISQEKLGDVLTTYFVASGYSEGFSDEELYYLTKAMVETGEKLEFKGVVADKHSIGGVPGTRVTLIVVPIIAAAGFKIPKSSSRAITTPAGTADAMEVLSGVTFDKEQIYKIVEKTNACIVWGGSFKIAPADDEIIKIEEPLVFESYDKIVVSVMAKKVAFGSTHVIIDLPYGRTGKIHTEDEAKVLKRKFEFLGHKFGIKVKALIHRIEEPAGAGVGPLLESRDSLKVLEQTEDRPIALEELALKTASELMDLCLEDADKEVKEKFDKKYKTTLEWASDILVSKQALAKMHEIIEAQGGKKITSKELHAGKNRLIIKAEKSGKINRVSSKNITLLSRLLGAPEDKKAGMILYKRLGDHVEKEEELLIFHTESEYRLREASDSYELFPVYNIEKSTN
jgi:putative thymidine phosphorylase